MDKNYYTKSNRHPDDVISEIKSFINELQIVQNQYYSDLFEDLNIKEDIDGWLFDYIFNEQKDIDITFTEYLNNHGKNYNDFIK